MKKIYVFLIISIIIFYILYFVNENNELNDKNTILNIAIIDSGINYNLEKLEKYDVYTNKTKTKDNYGHGTAVFEVIKEHTENFDRHNFFDIKVLNDKGIVSPKNFCKGIDYAIKKKSHLINISLGFTENNPVIEKCINRALNKNIIIVAASGDTLSKSTDYPAQYNKVISVAAIDKNDRLYSFSSTGKIDLVDYGVNIKVPSQDNEVSGSSFATAIVTSKYISYLQKKENNKKYVKKGSNFKILKYNS